MSEDTPTTAELISDILDKLPPFDPGDKRYVITTQEILDELGISAELLSGITKLPVHVSRVPFSKEPLKNGKRVAYYIVNPPEILTPFIKFETCADIWPRKTLGKPGHQFGAQP